MTELDGPVSYPVYPPVTPAPGRPGITTAAVVLGFVQAGLAMLGGLVTLFGALGASAEERDVRYGPDPFRAEVAAHLGLATALAVVVMLGSGLLIAGAVTLTSGRERVLYLAGMGLQLAFCIAYFALSAVAIHDANEVRAQTAESPGFGFMVAAVCFAVLPVLGLVFASVASTTKFLQVKGLESNRR
ncbi:hypothetical protein [Labedaea rhizosphaerae]|uniref:Uncharacterized protein n=1 Tax=Labedaea rhizosphaerae TaxID=598644 RepID=A0A4R6RY64_LABRH|nr:hypothetical protein [Labedaea rhizosphaerae]TDP91176.1 hypothetical protein EV186_109168 [Labedaea rhizosphaerae]